MQNLRRYQQAWWTSALLAAAVSVGPFALGARAQEMTEHGFCGASAGTSTCNDNGTITPTNSNPLTKFGFTRSPDNNKGLQGTISFDLVALVPDNAPGAGSQSLTYTGTGVGVTGPQTLAFQGDWTGTIGGDLDTFLKLFCVSGGCGPANPQSAFLAGEPFAGLTNVTGYDVYLFDYGTVNFGNQDPTFVPGGTFNGSLITGTELYSFIDETPGTGNCPSAPLPNGDTNCRQDGTAISSTIIAANGNFVPDGGMTLMLLGGGLVSLAGLRQRFRA